MTRIVCALAGVGLLAACSTQPKPIVISRTKVVQSAQLALTAIEGGVAAYEAKQPIRPDVKAKLLDADTRAHNMIAALQSAPAPDLPAAAQQFATAIQAVVAVLPPGAIPPQAEAGLVAFATLAQIVAQTIPQQEPGVVLSPPPAATPVVAPPPSAPIAAPPPDAGAVPAKVAS